MAKKKSDDAPRRADAPQADGRRSWFDDDSGEPLIHAYAERINAFLGAMADGKVEPKELSDQEKRVVKLMKKVEPKLDGPLHDDVTELLCELSAYNIMRAVAEIAEARPKAKFRG